MLRVPAHITVLFPFVPVDDLDAVCPKLKQIYADFAPFDVTLDGYGHFPTATYLKPVDPEPIKALFRAVHAEFPQYPPYRGAFSSDDITPHMTVGEFKTEAERQAAEFPPYAPISFTGAPPEPDRRRRARASPLDHPRRDPAWRANA